MSLSLSLFCEKGSFHVVRLFDGEAGRRDGSAGDLEGLVV